MYAKITQRIKSIRAEIHDLKQKDANTIKSRIDTLKQINLLLEEQNSLLLERQDLIRQRKISKH